MKNQIEKQIAQLQNEIGTLSFNLVELENKVKELREVRSTKVAQLGALQGIDLEDKEDVFED